MIPIRGLMNNKYTSLPPSETLNYIMQVFVSDKNIASTTKVMSINIYSIESPQRNYPSNIDWLQTMSKRLTID